VAINVNQLRSGAKVMMDTNPCSVIENEHVKPGKGPAFNRLKFRNLTNGRVIAKTFPSSADLEEADIIECSMRLLYVDHEGWHFMNEVNYEQCTMTEKELGTERNWLKDGVMAVVVVWEGKPISIVVDNFVELEVVECAPNAKGNTVSGGTKVAKLETGCEVTVPLFVEVGDIVKIDTRTGEYHSRTKS
jgi:elongation factor P